MSVLTRAVVSVVLLAAVAAGGAPVAVRAQVSFGEKQYDYRPGDVLPGATEFERRDAYWEGYRAGDGGARTLVGYVLLTDDLVQIPGYSGHTLNTLVGIDPAGKITGVKIVRHAEPIVLIGLSEKVIHDFVAQYVGQHIGGRIIISDEPKADYVNVNGISGATVTAVALNATLLEAARKVGRSVGIVQAAQVRQRRPSGAFTPMGWDELVDAGAIGSLVVRADQVGRSGSEPVLEVRFAVLDAPSVGRNLVGDRYYAMVRERLDKEGGSALYIAGSGPESFKGAGFARGGIFDRFAVEQGQDLFVFKDVEYFSLAQLPGDGAPDFDEGGIFFLKNAAFDPAEPFTFRLTLPYRVNDRRAYGTFVASLQLPSRFVEEETAFWATRWQASALPAALFALYIIAAAAVFALRQRLVRHRDALRVGFGVIAAVWVGLVLKAQPSTTQILTLVNSGVRGRFPFEIFLSEPVIFLFWITIVVSLVVWGRGFFCGWLCPYGALLEVVIAVWKRVVPARLREAIAAREPGPRWMWGKYATFLVILAVSFASLPAAEMLDEVEPFKTFVLHLVRPLPFVAYFVVITVVSVVVYRFFCRFLCPLGGALAIPSRRPAVPLGRWAHCTTCKICYRGCEPKAIAYDTGRIDYGECLQCWDCQATGQDTAVCPELIVAARERRAPRALPVALLALAVLAAVPARAKTVTVRPGAGTISAAIAASRDGDTIRVEPGVYPERLVVDKAVTLLGADGAVVDAGGQGHVVQVTAPNVRVEGFTLRHGGTDLNESTCGIRTEQGAANATLVNNRIEDCLFGIWVHGSENARVAGNRIAGLKDRPHERRGNCIHLWSARGGVIADNTLDGCRDGIYMELSADGRVSGNTVRGARYSVHTMWCDRTAFTGNVLAENLVGLALMFSKQVQADDNTVYNNATHGLLMTQVTHSSGSRNRIIGNSKGLFVYNSLYNAFRDNFIARNNLGLHYWGGAEDNDVTGNTFMANEVQVKFVAARDQVWDGNFWSDYVGWDVNGDGTGDVPYRSNTLVDTLLWNYPAAKILLASPAFQVLSLAEREFPVITVPKGVDRSPRMTPGAGDWVALLDQYPPKPSGYYSNVAKDPHLPGG